MPNGKLRRSPRHITPQVQHSSFTCCFFNGALLPMCCFSSRCLHQLGLCQGQCQKQEFKQGLPLGKQELRHAAHHCCHRGAVRSSRKARQEPAGLVKPSIAKPPPPSAAFQNTGLRKVSFHKRKVDLLSSILPGR